MAEPRVLRVAALLRVSTTHVEQEESPENQLSYIREEIRRRSSGDEIWVDTGLVYEDELTGALVLERPGIRKLLEDVQNGHIDLVATKSISRLGRDTLGLLALKRRLWDDLGIDLVALQDGYRASRDPELIFLVHADRAQAGRQEISQNVRTAMRQKALRGLWTAGTVPFGYRRKTRNTIEPDPATAPIVQEIFRLRGEGWGLTAIADYLNNVLQVPSPIWWRNWAQRKEKLEELAAEDERWAARLERARAKFEGKRPLWRVSSIAAILKNTAYYGELRYYRRYWRRVTGGKKRLVSRPVTEHISIPCPPLVSRELWERVQDFRVRRVAKGNPVRGRYLLTGLLYCAECGARMSGQRVLRPRADGQKDEYYYYMCQRRRDTNACSARAIPAWQLEEQVAQRLKEALQSLREGTPPEETHKPANRIESQIRHLRTLLEDLKDQRRYYRNEHRKGRVTDAELEEELERIAIQERELLERISRLTAEQQLERTRAHERQRILELWRRLERQEIADRRELRELFVAAIDKVVASVDEVHVYLRFAID